MNFKKQKKVVDLLSMTFFDVINTDLGDFRDATNTDDDYEYWLDGSLKKDKNKKISSITYNYLKLPKTITFDNGRTITTEYDASGTKLKKTLSTGKVFDYEEDEIYEDGVLYQTSHDEGRIVDGIYEYNITDHLGNTRVSFKDSAGVAKITQVNHVGAWGEPLTGINSVNTPKINNFTLSTYEKENDFGIGVFDAHARVFDPVTPRFWSIDALAELSRRFSPFVYGNDNPLRFIDPDGMMAQNVGADGLTNDQWLSAGGDFGREKEYRQENDDKDKKKKKEEQNSISIYNGENSGQSSKLFSNEADAYRYMWGISLLKKWGIRGREVGSILTNKGVLVTPYANNQYDNSGPGFSNAGLKQNNDYVSFEGKNLFILGIIHTHQALSLDGSPWALGYQLSPEDKDYAYKWITGKPIFAMGRDNNLYGYAWGNYGKIMNENKGFWTGHKVSELLDGSFKLIPTLKKIFKKP
jgi:RHS repeat-associated protein